MAAPAEEEDDLGEEEEDEEEPVSELLDAVVVPELLELLVAAALVLAWAEEAAARELGTVTKLLAEGTWTGMLETPAGREAAGCCEVTRAG